MTRTTPDTIDVIEHALFPETPPQQLGRFEIQRQLGRGGMGVVYLARDPQLKRNVAIKVHRGTATDEARAKLQREAEVLARVRHPNVVGVYESGRTDDGNVFVVMEFVDGPTMRDWVQTDRPTPAAIVDAHRQCAMGLHAAHRLGLVHGDFKPDNVVIDDDGRPRIIDFGLAHATRQPATVEPALRGTPGYLAPEIWERKSPSAASDQFALAVSLYECLAKALPLSNQRATLPSRPATIPRRIWPVVQRALDPEPEARFPTLSQMAQRLEPRSSLRVPVVGAGVLAALGGLAVFGLTSRGLGPAVAPQRLDADPCAIGTELLAEPGQWTTTNDDRVYFDEDGLHLHVSPDDRGFVHANIFPGSVNNRALVFKLEHLPTVDTHTEVYLSLVERADYRASIDIYGGEWVLPMAANMPKVNEPIDRTRHLWFRIQVVDQVHVADLVSFEYSADGQHWTPVARVEHSMAAPRVAVSLGSHRPLPAEDSVLVSSIRCEALEPIGALAPGRDLGRLESEGPAARAAASDSAQR